VKLKFWILGVKRSKEVLIPFDIEVRMQTTLHQHACTAELDRLIDPFADLLDRMDVRIRLSRTPIERAKRANYIANVRVINIAVDDVRDDIGRVVLHPDLVRGKADPHKIVRFEQCRAVIAR